MTFEDLAAWAQELCLGFEARDCVLITYGKKAELSVSRRKYADSWESGAWYISVHGLDRRSGYEGFATPCNSIEEAESIVFLYADKYGIKKRNVQLALF